MSWTKVASRAELPDTNVLAVTVGELELALVHVDDQVFAIENLCSHGQVELSEGDVYPEDYSIECYLHGACFDVRTGKPLNLPATEPISVYPCRLDGDDILVDVDNPTIQEN